MVDEWYSVVWGRKAGGDGRNGVSMDLCRERGFTVSCGRQSLYVLFTPVVLEKHATA